MDVIGFITILIPFLILGIKIGILWSAWGFIMQATKVLFALCAYLNAATHKQLLGD